MQREQYRAVVVQTIENSSRSLNSVSQEIWNHPEIGLQEFHAHDVLCDFLEKNDFLVERNFVLVTGFRATLKTAKQCSKRHVAVLCEYDALPGIGHACGHNLIAEVGIAAAIGIKSAIETQSTPIGQLTVFGTPAEETCGGKIDFLNAGAFADVDFAIMAHPSPYNISAPPALALKEITVKYEGNAAHSSSNPWDGVNALDAAVAAYNNISNLRQQLKPLWQVAGVIKKGGDAPNVIPESTEMLYCIRAPTVVELRFLEQKVTSCFEAAALATGCQVEVIPDDRFYTDLISNKTLVKQYEKNATELGVKFEPAERFASVPWGSADFGNVSHVVPGIQPEFYIGTDAFYHHKDFTSATGDEKAQAYTLTQAKALALTVVDILTDPDLFTEMKNQFEEDIKRTT